MVNCYKNPNQKEGDMKALIKFLALVFVLGTTEGKVIRIPQDWPYIQTGIEMATDGDTVLVAPGRYLITHPSKRINFQGKAILLTSEKGADSTVIDGWEEYGPIVTFESGEDTNSIIDGFTITNGRSKRGAGILCRNNSSPKICNNIITGNEVDDVYDPDFGGLGAGICCDTASPVIVGNVITKNHCQGAYDFLGSGGGIFLRNSSASILNNTISENWATWGGGIANVFSNYVRIERNEIERNEAKEGWINAGAGVYCVFGSSILIADNTVTGNFGTEYCEGGGIYCKSNSVIIVGNTITNNSASPVGGIYTSSSSAQVSENNIYGNTHYGLYSSDTTGVVDADSNWWGDKTGPYHPTLNPGGLGDTVSNWVDFEPWLSKPAGVGDDPSPRALPQGFSLSQNWPNPFNENTVIRYSLLVGRQGQSGEGGSRARTTSTSYVSLKVYNILGQEVRTLVDEKLKPGKYEAVWNGKSNSGMAVASGVYFYRLKVGKFGQTRKMVLLR